MTAIAAAPTAASSEAHAAETAPLLKLTGLVKDFPGVRALDHVDFELRYGEVHVLFGENGAGKSTLINVVAGALRPGQGTFELQGEPIHLHSVHDARGLGIAAVFQEFSLAPDLTVEDNLFLGAEPVRGFILDRRAAHLRARKILDRLGFPIDPRATVATLSRAEQQMVEIAKALHTNPRVLILDEPTASLTEREIVTLFRLVRALRDAGVGIIYITHRIAEIQEIGDRVTVLRDGRRIDTRPVADVTQKILVELMTGRKVGEFFPVIDHRPAETLLSIRNLGTWDGRVSNVSIDVRAGEIVGLAGLVGCGKSEIGRACFGASPFSSGEIEFLGKHLVRPTPKGMLHGGLCYTTSDRRQEGLMLERVARENISLSVLDLKALSWSGILRIASEKTLARRLAERMKISPLNLESEVSKYSGGNQQKIMLARAVAREIRLFVFDEPTLGIDVGAKIEIYNFLKSLVEARVGVLLISSELPEILNLCHRVYVVRQGTIGAHLEGPEISERRVLAGFFGEDNSASR